MPNDNKRILAEEPSRIVGLIVGAVIAIGGFAFAGWQWARPTPDTELAQWIPAIAAVATLLAAIVAAVYASGAFRVEWRREQRLLDDAERSQAVTFAAWGTPGGVSSSRDQDGNITYAFEGAVIQLRNGSDLPIYDVLFLARVYSADAGLEAVEMSTREENLVDLVPPQQTTQLVTSRRIVVVAPVHHGTAPREPVMTLRVAVQFRDTAGTYWRRHANGDFEKGHGELRC